MSPVARYEEVLPWWRKTFELHDDRLAVRFQRLFGARAEEIIPLEDLLPTESRVWVKDSTLHSILVVAAICSPLTLFLLSVFVSRLHSLTEPAMWVFLAAIPVSLAYIIFDPRRIEYIHFRRRSGGKLLIGRLGTNRDECEPFVQALSAKVRTLAAQSPAGGPPKEELAQ